MIGLIISNKMQKAVSVMVYTTKRHPKYKKTYKVRKKYLASCTDSSKFVVNQQVEIVSCRPVSKLIHFKVLEN